MRDDQIHQILRTMMGNQIAMMRALRSVASPNAVRDLETRCHDIKDWWRHEFGEEVGFSTSHGDIPKEKKETA